MWNKNIHRIVVMGEFNRRKRVRVDLKEFDLLPSKVTVEKLLRPSVYQKENILDRRNSKGGLRKRRLSSCSFFEEKICVELPDSESADSSSKKVLQKYRKPLGDLLDIRQENVPISFSSECGLPQRKTRVGLLTSYPDCCSKFTNLQTETHGSIENGNSIEIGCSKSAKPQKTPKTGYQKKRTLLSNNYSPGSKKILIRREIASPPSPRSFSFVCLSKSPRLRLAKSGLPFKCSTPIIPSKMSERRGTKGLELWCKKMTEGYPGVKIDNMTSSWRDGLAFCAIIHHFRPDLIDFSKLHKDDVYHNNELAFRVAEHHLGIPALLEPEDMVEYSVPDRLSILTYLSQFYQAFAAPQGSAARIAPKRPQTVPDHGIVSPASTSPPTKMALTSAGKIRREPCTKCALPVFIAERLNVGKLLFHRTCFRCARCSSQLTLANYYETENGEFCCEICPDEEKLMSKKATETLLLRSLSDEEKSASLKMITNDPDEFSTMFETALESAESDNVSGNEFTQARSQFIKSQMEGSDLGLDEEPPDLPRTLPPELSKSDKTDGKDSIVDSARFDSGFPKRPDTTVNNSNRISVNKRDGSSAALDESRNVVTKDISAQEGDISLVKARMRLFENSNSKHSDISKSDVYRKSRSSEKVPQTPEKSPVKTIPIVRLEELENFDTSINKVSDKNNKNINETIVSIIKDETKHKEQRVSNEEIVEQTPIQEEFDHHTIEDGTMNDEINKSEVINKEPPEQTESTIIIRHTADESKDEVILIEDSPKKTDSQQNLSGSMYEASQVSAIASEEMSSKQTEGSLAIRDTTDESKDEVILIEDSPKKTEPYENLCGTVSETSQVSAIASEETSPISLHEKKADDSFASVVSVVISDESAESPIVTKEQEAETFSSVRRTPDMEESKLKLRLDTTEDSVSSSVTATSEYPDDLDPFGDEDQEDDPGNRSLNPFGSEDEEDEPEPSKQPKKLVKPIVSEREENGTPEHLSSLTVERISINPFDEPYNKPSKPLASPRMRKKVIPIPADREIEDTPEHLARARIERISVNPFETSPRPVARKKKVISPTKGSLNPFSSDDEDHEQVPGGQPVPTPRISRTPVQPPEPKPRESGYLSLGTKLNFGSNSSISSGSAYGSARKKKPAPRPPIPTKFDESANSSLTSSPNHSLQHSPNLAVRQKKQKKAPAPPIPKFASTPVSAPNDNSFSSLPSPIKMDMNEEISEIPGEYLRKNFKSDDCGTQHEKNVKDETNRNRRSQETPLQKSTSEEQLPSLTVPNKSTFGKWKRRKGQAPSKPIPQKRTIKCLPIAEIRRELEFIEIQQQGLEKQGVRLEQIIREKCEGTDMNTTEKTEDDIPIDVEDLILQLFELVNEKNELFRKQTELMYLRRQQRLEEEHADVEYQIRCLMLQPEANKTDSDKAREEELINRLIDIVERRNEIVECLEMDRVREAEEDDSISNHINLYTLNREADKSVPDNPKKDKDKKKHKKEKKSKNKSKDNVDMDKDVDESETYSTLEKKKKKKFALF